MSLRKIGLSLLAFASVAAVADEGMWLFELYDQELRGKIKSAYNFDPSADWLTHLQRSAVKFPSGSGSFISSTGLILTNHHVAAGAIAGISGAASDFLKNGFLADSLEKEIKAPGMTVTQLMSIENVTERVRKVVTPDLSPEQAAAALRKVSAEIETECKTATQLSCSVQKLYNGARYHLYRSKEFTDLRIVFAPEKAIAFFGGDPANFEFPRHDLDMAIFRAYENGKPAVITDYLKWSANGAADQEPVFVAGHPASTKRGLTAAALRFLRDEQYPYILNFLKRTEIALQQYSIKSKENKRQAEADLFGIQNSRKVFGGIVQALKDNNTVLNKEIDEQKLRGAALEKPELKKYVDAWDRIQKAKTIHTRLSKRQLILEGRRTSSAPFGFNSSVYFMARTLVRLAEEDLKPNDQRLPEYRDGARAALLAGLFSEGALYPNLEVAKLADSLAFFSEELGATDPLVQAVLGDTTPIEKAKIAVLKSGLLSVENRKFLAYGNTPEEKKARLQRIKESADPMIRLVRLVDGAARKVRAQYDSQVEAVENTGYADIAAVKAAIQGVSGYPDATFTLRLSYGAIKGSVSNEGKNVSPFTTIGEAFDAEIANEGEYPWALPERWHKSKGAIALNLPFNFISTNDIIGGNSGSPVVNRNAELVGLIFDGNIESTSGDLAYADNHRAVSVHSAAMMEALRKIYNAGKLADEISH